ncbi:hypothetical protein [Bergeyella zoohelcum]|uniref:Uncharacterized protein n=1 Tax=Bergeyella zoohelcum ATCC 43767 TaxID=883096 RepID=K1MKS7_9FLAO|nr:hypothetical protein [Bergeyella zoohelcum]EKB56579.1 hypothetical protein HMPREF9699_01308 [Bergeyella zoohelcum ATCC 43767]SUV48513.1 Uncharacterised protein [Bergeyella zoohelcum]
MKILLKQQISGNQLFPKVKRFVTVYGTNIDGRHEQIVIDADFMHENENGEDVSHLFVKRIKDWIVNNDTKTTMRDLSGNPIPNPNYVTPPSEDEEDTRTEDQKDEYMKAPSFDYFSEIILNPDASNLVKLLSIHIAQNDAVGFFDEILK